MTINGLFRRTSRVDERENISSCKTRPSVTVFPSNATPHAYEAPTSAAESTTELFQKSYPLYLDEHSGATICFTSYDGKISSGDIHPSSDGFIRGAIDAWAQHQHLMIRPDEVWFSILVQMNLYMTKNAEKLRHIFVDHSGQERLLVLDDNIKDILHGFLGAINANVKTHWLRDWVLPNFSTTTVDDEVTASVMLMGLMKQYFNFEGGIICGFPSVTLLGEKADWMLLLKKLDRLQDFGDEPERYARQLRPIFSRFVRTFDEPDQPEIKAFWNSMVFAKEEGICGLPDYSMSGWLTGLFFWNPYGRANFDATTEFEHMKGGITLDGVTYKNMFLNKVPIGITQVPFTIRDYGNMSEFPAYIAAGNMGKRIRPGLPPGYSEALSRYNGSTVDESLSHGLVEPLSGWVIYGPAPKEKNGPQYGHDTFDFEEENIYSTLNKAKTKFKCHVANQNGDIKHKLEGDNFILLASKPPDLKSEPGKFRTEAEKKKRRSFMGWFSDPVSKV